jgi:hypothetical protein
MLISISSPESEPGLNSFTLVTNFWKLSEVKMHSKTPLFQWHYFSFSLSIYWRLFHIYIHSILSGPEKLSNQDRLHFRQIFLKIDSHVTSRHVLKGKMITNGKYVRIWKAAIVAYFMVLTL